VQGDQVLCKKIASKMTPSLFVFCKILIEKVAKWASYVIFKLLPKVNSKNSPNRVTLIAWH
jgi:hypothetical protein